MRRTAKADNQHSVEETLLEGVDLIRLDATRRLDESRRMEMGQFLTPAPVARFMASMFTTLGSVIRLLDAGAGVGSLSAAFIAEMCRSKRRPTELLVTAYEVDPVLLEYLRDTFKACRAECERAGIKFVGTIRQEDFIRAGVLSLRGDLFSPYREERFTCAILNPPYRKINTDSEERRLLQSIGVETSNLYTAFLSIVTKLLEPSGELVAITPRSFCNGLYFKPFRRLFLELMSLRRIHVFESRSEAFREDDVLQENIIFHAVKRTKPRGTVIISSNGSPEDESTSVRRVPHDTLVRPDDPDLFIRLTTDELDQRIAQRMDSFQQTLEDLGLSVSTGRVVDFRTREFLRARPTEKTAPLIYPGHLGGGCVTWPKLESKKPNAILIDPRTEDLLVPRGVYALVKRFSAKEERRRVVAAVYDPDRIAAAQVGFENHLNYYHRNGGGLPLNLAKGLVAFLNSTLVDSFFRQFSGHTQVNAVDLRSLKYPTEKQLEALGSKVGATFPEQNVLDHLIAEGLFAMANNAASPDPVRAKKRIEEALSVLKDLGLPREQQNERSALTLLALLDLKPDTPWAKASAPLCGITQMMEWFEKHYGKKYAPNTRETVRRSTVHQFVQAGLVIANPDKPSRPINSPKTVYQVEPKLLDLLRRYGTTEWVASLKSHLTSVETLQKQFAKERRMLRIPVQVAPGTTIGLSPGGHNALVKKILDEFCSRFTPGGKMVYVGDTEEKWAYFDSGLLSKLGANIERHGKMPDVVVHHQAKNWLVLIEAVTSHGPVNPKRQRELKDLFKGSKAGLVFVTAFLDRKTLVKHLSDIAWETEIWIAEHPAHLIHFNGERFLGPYA